jgi:hypothetical protein
MLSFFLRQIAVGRGVKSAKDADDLIAYDTATGKLYLDMDGFGGSKAVELITFSNKPNFTAEQLADEVLVVSLIGDPASRGLFGNWLQTEYL